MARMNLYFPHEKEKEQLEKEARKLGISPSSLVRIALRRFYEKQKHEKKIEKGQ